MSPDPREALDRLGPDAGRGLENRPRSATVVLPVRNQAEHIGRITESYIAACEPIPLEVDFILVPNACSDDSERVAADLARSHEIVRTIPLREGGWGRAVRAGLPEARADLVAYTNSARTTPEMLALTLLYASVYPGVVVKANRRVRDSLRRRLGSLLYNLECRALFDLTVWDINGTPKVFPRSFARLLELKRDDDMIDAEFNAICRREHYPVIEVPLLETVRHSGKSTTNYASALKMYVGALRLRAELGSPPP